MAVKCLVCYDRKGGCSFCNPALAIKKATRRVKQAVTGAATDAVNNVKAAITGKEQCGYRDCTELQSNGCGMFDCPFARNFQARKRRG